MCVCVCPLTSFWEQFVVFFRSMEEEKLRTVRYISYRQGRGEGGFQDL